MHLDMKLNLTKGTTLTTLGYLQITDQLEPVIRS